MARRSWSKSMVALARSPRPPAAAVAAVSRAPDDPAHAGLHDRVLDADQVAEPGVETVRASGGHLLVAEAARVESRAMTSSSSAVGARVSGTSASTASSKPVAATTSSTVTPGCTRRSRMRWSGLSKSSTREVGDDAPELVVLAHPVAELGGAVVPDAGHDVDLLHEHLGRVVGDPVAGDVLHRVAGRAAHAEQLHLRVRRVADEGEVLVAVAVDLATRPSSRDGGPTTPRRTWPGRGSTPRPSWRGRRRRAGCRWRRGAPHRRSSPGRVRTRRGPGGRRWRGWCRSGWP